LARQEDTRFVPRVALEELNPDLDFEVMGEDDYGASRTLLLQLQYAFIYSWLTSALLHAQPCRTTTTTMTTIKQRRAASAPAQQRRQRQPLPLQKSLHQPRRCGRLRRRRWLRRPWWPQ